jgi:inorganic pyrophosphatase
MTEGLAALPTYDAEGRLLAVVEAPRGSANKLKFDPATGVLFAHKVLPPGCVFPFDFGFIPGTLGEDGDPLDVLVLMDEPAFTGCHVPVRLIGAIEAEQTEDDGEPERNDRLIGVASTAKLYEDIKELSDITEPLIDQIEHFFISYNMEKGKKFEPRGRVGARVAHNFVEAGRKKAKKKRGKGK